MAILFKSIQTDDHGKPIYWKKNVPKLTHTGRVVLILVILSSVISVYAGYKKSIGEDEAKKKQEEAEATLKKVQRQNDVLNAVLEDVHKQGKFISDEQQKNFASVLTEQKETGERIASDIDTSAKLLRGRVDNS